QVMWSLGGAGERYVIEARDGGWRWQWWTGNVLRGQAGLAFAPPAWTPGETVAFPSYSPPTQDGCAGAFMIRDPNGGLVSDGTCDNAQWTRWTTYDPLGHVTSVSHRDADSSDSQSFDTNGVLVSRTQVDGMVETDETWYPDGTPQGRYVRRDAVM